GILFLPFVTTSVSWASVSLCTSGEAKSRTFVAFPAGVFPLPSAAWHIAHLALKTLAESSARVQMDKRKTSAHPANEIWVIRIIEQFIEECPPMGPMACPVSIGEVRG